MLMTVSLTASAQAVMLSEDFEGQTVPPEGWTVIDNDSDGHCWEAVTGSSSITQYGSSKCAAVSFTRNPSNYSSYGAQDNWLVTPAIRVTNGAYTLTLAAAAQDTEHTENLEVLISTTGKETADFTPLKKQTLDNGYEDNPQWETVNVSLAEYEGQDVYVAFRHQGSASYGLSLDNIQILNMKAPQKPSTFTLTPGANGALEAMIEWTNPSRCADGSELGDFEVIIIRDSEEIAVLSDGLTAGETSSYTDKGVSAGEHTYYIKFRNAEGTTAAAGRRAYFGPDLPKAPRNVRSTVTDGAVTVAWDPVTEGVNRGYIDPEAITYNITRSNADGESTTVATGVKGTQYIDRPDANVAWTYAVTATNSAGTSEADYTSSSILFDSEYFDVTVYENGSQDNYAPKAPVELSSKNSMTQALYFPADLRGAQGEITDLVYKSFKGTGTVSPSMTVYISNTDLTDLSGKWVTTEGATKVFEGSVSIVTGTNDMHIHLDTPYTYEGGNIVVTFVSSMTATGSYVDRFWTSPTDVDRLVTGTSYSDPIDPASPPYGSTAKYVPMTRFIIKANNLGAVNGKVESTDGEAIAGAQVSVAGLDYLTQLTDADGRFSMPFVPTGEHSFTVTATGYTDLTETVTVSASATAEPTFRTEALKKVNLSGAVFTDDTRSAAEGASIRLGGYDSRTVTADASGAWTIEGIYADKTYTLEIIYPLYDAYRTELTPSEDVALGDITLTRSVIAPWGVTVETTTDGSAANVGWNAPMTRTGEPGVHSIGHAYTHDSQGGDFYNTDYCIGHFFSTDTIAANNLTGLSISAVSAYIKATTGRYFAAVWEGTRDEHTLLAETEIPMSEISAEGGWVKTEFAEAVEVREGKQYIAGIRVEGAEDNKVFGLAPYSTNYKRDFNNLKWSDDPEAYCSNAYDAWNITADFIIPGASGAVADNPEVPACEYNVWRRTVADTGKGEWEKLTAQPVAETTLADGTWATISSGTYEYAVSAIYHTGESAYAISEPRTRSNDYDAALTAFISPVKSIDKVSEITVEVELVNLGEKTIENVPVEVTLSDGTVLEGSSEGTLNHGESTTVKVGSATITEGVYTLTAKAKLEGDEVASNDELTLIYPNLSNIPLTGYRWNAYGNAGMMTIDSNAPEHATFLKELIPGDALITAGEYFDGNIYAYTATWFGRTEKFVKLDAATLTVLESKDCNDVYAMDMAYDYSTDKMYVLGAEGEQQYIATVDLETAEPTIVAVLSLQLHALACTTKGQLYGISSEGDLVSIDKATGASSAVGATGVAAPQYLQSMAYDHDNDRLFWAAESRTCGGLLHEIDITTGAASALGNVLYMGSEPCEIVALHAPCENKSGVTSVAAGTGEVNIAVDGDCITVTCDEGLAVSVCDVDGRVIASAHGPATFRNIGQGIVLVKAGETVKKVVVK